MFKEFFSDREPDIILQPYETLFNHMQPADCAYVIQDGSIELFISDEQIATIEKDDLLGEMALFEGGYRSATAQAGGEGAVLFKLLTGEFMDFIAERPDFAFKVMQRTTERLREMDTRTMQYKYAVASMKDGVLVIDQEGLILSVNDSAMQILGIVSADEFENRMLGEAFANLRYAENEEFIASLESSLSIKDYVDNKVVKFANGSIQSTLSLTTSELFDSDNDDMSGIIAVFRDISELQELREKEIALGKEVKRRHDELARAYMSIEESNSEMESTLKRVSSMRLIGLVLIILVLGLVGGITVMERFRPESGINVAELDKSQIVRAPVTIKPVSTLGPLPSEMAPFPMYPVHSEVSAKIERVNFVAGQVVQEGYNLARLDVSGLQTELELASGKYVAAVDRLNKVTEKGEPGEIGKAKLDLAIAEKELDNIESLMKRNTIRATAGGAVVIPDARKRISEDENVEKDSLFLYIVDMNPVLFYSVIGNGAFGKIHVGQKASVVAQSFRGMTLDAEVVALSPVEDKPNTFELAVVAKRLDPEQRASFDPSAPLGATVEIFDRPDAITAPISSVKYENGIAKIKIWDKKMGQVRLVSVQTGVTTLDTVEILSGIGPEDEVVID